MERRRKMAWMLDGCAHEIKYCKRTVGAHEVRIASGIAPNFFPPRLPPPVPEGGPQYGSQGGALVSGTIWRLCVVLLVNSARKMNTLLFKISHYTVPF